VGTYQSAVHPTGRRRGALADLTGSR
jgi:hypothetical protein